MHREYVAVAGHGAWLVVVVVVVVVIISSSNGQNKCLTAVQLKS